MQVPAPVLLRKRRDRSIFFQSIGGNGFAGMVDRLCARVAVALRLESDS